MLGRALTAQDHLDERSAGSPVAIHEWMDGLKLSMRDRGLRQCWQPGSVAEVDEVSQQAPDELRRRWHVGRAHGRIVAAAHPILPFSQLAALVSRLRAFRKHAVNLTEGLERYLITSANGLNGSPHGGDVGKRHDLRRIKPVGNAKLVEGLDFEYFLRGHRHAFDPRRGQRL